MIDKPLYGNPLAGGLSFRQEGDMGRYIADNDPGGIAAGFSNLEDYLAAGNQLPKQKTPNDLLGVSNANFNVSPPGTLKLDPQATMPDTLGPQLLNPLEDPFSNITAPGQIPERYRQGFEDFYKQNPDDFMRMGGQAISYVTTPQGETIRFGDTGGASNFRRYLESIGETPKPSYGDLSISTELAPDNNAFPASPGFTPLPTIPKAIASPGLPPPEAPSPNTIVSPLQPMSLNETNPYQEQFTGFQNQLTGFNDQFSSMGDRLTKLEEGITSLLNQNGGFGFNSMQPKFGAPNYGYSPFSMTGLGSLFGGYYG